MRVLNDLITGAHPSRRHSLSGAAVAALCAALLAGCGGATPGTSGGSTGGGGSGQSSETGATSPAGSGDAVTEQEIANLEKLVSGAEDVADQAERETGSTP